MGPLTMMSDTHMCVVWLTPLRLCAGSIIASIAASTTGKVLGPATAHDGVDGELLDGGFPALGRHGAEALLGVATRRRRSWPRRAGASAAPPAARRSSPARRRARPPRRSRRATATRRRASSGQLASEAHDRERARARSRRRESASRGCSARTRWLGAPSTSPASDLAVAVEDRRGDASRRPRRSRPPRRTAPVLRISSSARRSAARVTGVCGVKALSRVVLRYSWRLRRRQVGEQELADGRAVERPALADARRVADRVLALDLVDVDGDRRVSRQGRDERGLPALCDQVLEEGPRQLGQLAIRQRGHGQREGGGTETVAPVGAPREVAQRVIGRSR